jgi:hypothetical protein
MFAHVVGSVVPFMSSNVVISASISCWARSVPIASTDGSFFSDFRDLTAWLGGGCYVNHLFREALIVSSRRRV